jgi:hypothetical protein
MDRILRNRKIIIRFFRFIGSRGKAKIKEISISKIKNKRAIKKNWKENGILEVVIIWNPHSNWFHFSFVEKVFFVARVIRRNAIDKIVLVNRIEVNFIFPFYFLFGN